MNEDEIQAQAIEFAKKNKESIAKKLTDTSIYKSESNPISVFMAGSPGAGKTEFSRILITVLEENKYIRKKVIRIDADDLRARMPGYTGNNSHLFQAAISIVVDRIQDLVLKQKQSFVLDGTLFDYDRAVKNFQRSIRRGRKVYIWYVYQNPEVAWRFTKAREEVEGRKIPREAFIKQFLGARDTVERIRKEFGEEVTVMLVKKDFEKHSVEKIAEIKQDGRQIDDYITERYTKDDLDKNI